MEEVEIVIIPKYENQYLLVDKQSTKFPLNKKNWTFPKGSAEKVVEAMEEEIENLVEILVPDSRQLITDSQKKQAGEPYLYNPFHHFVTKIMSGLNKTRKGKKDVYYYLWDLKEDLEKIGLGKDDVIPSTATEEEYNFWLKYHKTEDDEMLFERGLNQYDVQSSVIMEKKWIKLTHGLTKGVNAITRKLINDLGLESEEQIWR